MTENTSLNEALGYRIKKKKKRTKLKVWILLSSDSNLFYIEGVFLSKKKAKQQVKDIKSGKIKSLIKIDDYTIEDWEVR
ncbi:MAG: hypothetical protein GY804_01020 [Alphaproteobacteria bacterium]|nr:hypothetical protein [Alphaproteobacteria bacterium]